MIHIHNNVHMKQEITTKDELNLNAHTYRESSNKSTPICVKMRVFQSIKFNIKNLCTKPNIRTFTTTNMATTAITHL